MKNMLFGIHMNSKYCMPLFNSNYISFSFEVNFLPFSHPS